MQPSSLDEAVLQSMSACRDLTQLNLALYGAKGLSSFLRLLPSHPLPALSHLTLKLPEDAEPDFSPLAACSQLTHLTIYVLTHSLSDACCAQLQLPSSTIPSLRRCELMLQ